jgi:predicted outer membrane repeat protein
MQWGAAGAAVAATVAAGMGSASAAMAAPVVTISVGCSVSALSNAINFAPSDAILVLKSGCFYGLTAKLPNVTSNITIQGSNDTIARVGGGSFTAITIQDAQLTINQLTMRGFDGKTNLPGAIHNNGGTLIITKSTFADNEGDAGGAILNNNSGTLTASASAFGGNEATTGGAIENRNNSTATLNTDTFIGNEANTGGAIFISSGHVTVTGTSSAASASTQFADNDATGAPAVVGVKPAVPVTFGFGGAIDNFGGTLTATFTSFTGNDADEDGGALWNGGGTSNVSNSAFSHNFADDDGGAIAATKSLNLTSDNITANRANDDGGGIFVNGGTTSLNQTIVSGNSAGSSGGGIYRNSGNVSLTNGSIVRLNSPNNCSNFFC